MMTVGGFLPPTDRINPFVSNFLGRVAYILDLLRIGDLLLKQRQNLVAMSH